MRTHLVAIPIVLVTAACLVLPAQANDRVVILGQANGDGTVAAREVQMIVVSR